MPEITLQGFILWFLSAVLLSLVLSVVGNLLTQPVRDLLGKYSDKWKKLNERQEAELNEFAQELVFNEAKKNESFRREMRLWARCIMHHISGVSLATQAGLIVVLQAPKPFVYISIPLAIASAFNAYYVVKITLFVFKIGNVAVRVREMEAEGEEKSADLSANPQKISDKHTVSATAAQPEKSKTRIKAVRKSDKTQTESSS